MYVTQLVVKFISLLHILADEVFLCEKFVPSILNSGTFDTLVSKKAICNERTLTLSDSKQLSLN